MAYKNKEDALKYWSEYYKKNKERKSLYRKEKYQREREDILRKKRENYIPHPRILLTDKQKISKRKEWLDKNRIERNRRIKIWRNKNKKNNRNIKKDIIKKNYP